MDKSKSLKTADVSRIRGHHPMTGLMEWTSQLPTVWWAPRQCRCKPWVGWMSDLMAWPSKLAGLLGGCTIPFTLISHPKTWIQGTIWAIFWKISLSKVHSRSILQEHISSAETENCRPLPTCTKYSLLHQNTYHVQCECGALHLNQCNLYLTS